MGFLFEFDVILAVWLAEIIIQLKIVNCKTRNVGFWQQRRENDVTQQL